MHVVASDSQVRIIRVIHHDRLVAPGEEMSAQPVSRIEAHRVRAQQPLHAADQISQGRLHHQVKMTLHQAVSVHLPLAFGACFAQCLHPELSIGIPLHDFLASIAPAHHTGDGRGQS
jgi:hypothetical protein